MTHEGLDFLTSLGQHNGFLKLWRLWRTNHKNSCMSQDTEENLQDMEFTKNIVEEHVQPF